MMKRFNCLKGEKAQKRCEVIVAVVILALIMAGWALAASGCNKRTIDFTKNYYFCEEVGNINMYYGGLLLIFFGVMSLFGWIFSILMISKQKQHEKERQSYEVPVNEHTSMDYEPYEEEPLNSNLEDIEEVKLEEVKREVVKREEAKQEDLMT